MKVIGRRLAFYLCTECSVESLLASSLARKDFAFSITEIPHRLDTTQGIMHLIQCHNFPVKEKYITLVATKVYTEWCVLVSMHNLGQEKFYGNSRRVETFKSVMDSECRED